MTLPRCSLAATIGLLLLGPSPAAQAHGGVEVAGSTLRYLALDPGTVSDALLAPAADGIEISDPTVFGGISPGDCVPITEHRVRCPAGGITQVVASVGPEDDAVTSELSIAVSVRGGAGDDALTGGGGDDALNGDAGADAVAGRAGNDRLTDTSGVDVLDGGSGDDVIASRDDSADRVRCGAGNDTVTADVLDVLEDEPACESVRRGLPIAMAPAPPSALRDTTRPALSRLLVRPATSRLRRRRRPALSWRLSEPGRVTFSVAQLRGRRWRTLHRLVRRGRAGSNTVALRLAFPGRRVRAGRYRIVARAADRAGNRSARRRTRFRILPATPSMHRGSGVAR